MSRAGPTAQTLERGSSLRLCVPWRLCVKPGVPDVDDPARPVEPHSKVAASHFSTGRLTRRPGRVGQPSPPARPE